MGVPAPPPHRHDAFGAAPDAFGDLGQGGQEAEDVIVVIAAIAQQQFVVLVAPRADPAHVGLHLSGRNPIGLGANWSVLGYKWVSLGSNRSILGYRWVGLGANRSILGYRWVGLGKIGPFWGTNG